MPTNKIRGTPSSVTREPSITESASLPACAGLYEPACTECIICYRDQECSELTHDPNSLGTIIAAENPAVTSTAINPLATINPDMGKHIKKEGATIMVKTATNSTETKKLDSVQVKLTAQVRYEHLAEKTKFKGDENSKEQYDITQAITDEQFEKILENKIRPLYLANQEMFSVVNKMTGKTVIKTLESGEVGLPIDFTKLQFKASTQFGVKLFVNIADSGKPEELVPYDPAVHTVVVWRGAKVRTISILKPYNTPQSCGIKAYLNGVVWLENGEIEGGEVDTSADDSI